MGCLKKILFKIVMLVLVVAFFYFGGGKLACELIKKYQNPPREVVIKSAKTFGDFNKVESDYQIGRTLNLPNYGKMTVTHKPSGQKIRFVRLSENKKIKEEDFTQDKVNEKLLKFIKDNNIQLVSTEGVKVNTLGTLDVKGKKINYANFTISIEKNFLKQDFNGFIGYHNIVENGKNKGQVAIISVRNKDKFSEKIVRDLMQTIDFN